ncbi:hypothetical protein OPQ81_004818 [Rhizoctonia solani]|nr:hypothetical protein OPQ81_004818 [Rhizoctonia solani]
MERTYNPRSQYNSSYRIHVPIDHYEDYSIEHRNPPNQSRRAPLAGAHPQSDDYFDDIDSYSSPTPLPCRSTGTERRAMELGIRQNSSAHIQEGRIPQYSYDAEQIENYDRPPSKGNCSYNNQASYFLSKGLVPISTLPDWCRGVFNFGVFNAMQSQCFNTAVNTNSNMVISGKLIGWKPGA